MAEPVPRATPLRRDAVLEAVTFAAERLLLATDWHETIDEVLARFGIAARVSRAVIVEVTHTTDGLREDALAEWCAPGVPATLGIVRENAPLAPGFERWSDAMTAGQPILGDVETFPPEEREVLGRFSISSLAYYPITVEGEWWGSIGFEDCDGPRPWSLADLDGARTAAAMLGAAITRQRQDARLRDAETRYRGVVERIPAVTYVDVAHPAAVSMAFLSPQIEALLGYPPARFLDDPDSWFDLVHPDDQTRVDEAARHAGAAGEAFDEEYRMRHADGHWVWVHDTSNPVPSVDGMGTRYFQGFLLDVTARKQAEAALEDAERRYRRMVEALPAVTYIDQPVESGEFSTVMPFVSPQIATVLGYEPGVFETDPTFWFSIMHPDDLARMKASGELSVENVHEVTQEYRMRHANGRWIWVQDTSSPVYDDAGSLQYFQGFLVDVSKRHQAEERLREAEERFRALVERMPAMVYTESLVPDSLRPAAIDYVSEHAETMLGYPSSWWTSSPDRWTQVVHPDDAAAVFAAGDESHATGTPFSSDYRMVAADGRTVWVHEEAVLIRDAAGLPTNWQGIVLDVSERVEATERIRIAEERYRQIVEHTPVVSYQEAATTEAFDPTTPMLYVSPQIQSILGYPAARWLEPGFWASVTHADDLAHLADGAERFPADGEPYRAEYRMIASDGRTVWFHDEAHLVRDLHGSPVSWQGVLVDITDRREAEEQLRRAQGHLQALIDHIPAVVYREAPDAAPERFYISPQVADIFGYTPDEWTWTPDFWVDHLHPEDRQAVLDAEEASTASREPYSRTYRFRRADGSYVWVQDEAVFLQPDLGEEGSWQGLLFDVTARMEAEEQLRDAEERFRLIVEQGPAIFYQQEFDPANPDVSRTTYVSPQQGLLFGYTEQEMLEDPTLWARTVHPDDRAWVLAADIASNRDLAEHLTMEYRMISKDGRIVWVQDSCSIVQVPGKAPYWQGFMVDITERKQAEEQLARALEVEREATRRLRALDEMKNTFLQAVSHDLRTPLAAILGLAITLERGDVHLEEDDAKDLAHRIAGNARRLDRLVTNLLDLDRLARGIVTPNLVPTDVGAITRRVVAESDLIPDARLRTEFEPVLVPADAAKFERIVENLLANTARHTPVTSTVWVRVLRTDEGAVLAIEDDGDGVPEEIRESIFEPFQQGPNAPRHSPGVGVGLTLVRRFAELHGGRAWVEEREGGGASFRVLLPFDPPAENGPSKQIPAIEG